MSDSSRTKQTIFVPHNSGPGYRRIVRTAHHVDVSYEKALPRGIITWRDEKWIVSERGGWCLGVKVSEARDIKHRNYLRGCR